MPLQTPTHRFADFQRSHGDLKAVISTLESRRRCRSQSENTVQGIPGLWLWQGHIIHSEEILAKYQQHCPAYIKEQVDKKRYQSRRR